MIRKTLKIVVGLILIFAVAVGLISRKHPIILKWLTGSARIIGRPINAIAYTDGQFNPDIKIFHVDTYWNGEKADYFLLYFTYANTDKTKEVISLNRKENYVGKPSSTNKSDYDLIAGLLFQSDMGKNFTPFTDDMKGYGFDPQLTLAEKQIQLKVPPQAKKLKCDSIRVEL